MWYAGRRYWISILGIVRARTFSETQLFSWPMDIIIIIIIIIIICYATKILNTETDSKCRLCQHFDETMGDIITACPILAKEQYIKRRDGVCAQLHFNICKETVIVKLDKKTLV